MNTFANSPYISGDVLLPQVTRLKYQYCSSLINNTGGFRRANAALEILPYSLGNAALAMFELTRDQIAIASAKASVESPNTISELQESQKNLLGYRLDAFLDAARRTQNAIIPYLRQNFPKLSISKSLTGVIENLRNDKLQLPEQVRSQIIDYWDCYGEKLKSYRDLGQHYMIVATEARVFIPTEGTPALIFCLPNNPDTRPLENLSYTNPQVHVQQFVQDQFLNLLAFCYSILENLLKPNVPAAILTVMGGRTQLEPSMQAYFLPTIDQVENDIKTVLDTLLKKHSHAPYRDS
ncbi:MAG: hypothetical protein AAB354_05590 [candidate division KSB1 bacterium]